MSPGQAVRRSQFVTTYGPGAVLEGPDGSRVIPSLEIGSVFTGRRLADFEVSDQRLSDALLGGAGILRLPSNAELGRRDSDAIYTTRRFPKWSLCPEHGRLYKKTTNDFRACPICPPQRSAAEAWRASSRQGIRFVRACSEGHLDDVDWVGLVPHHAGCTRPPLLQWLGGGGALRNVEIQCTDCRGHFNLGVAYGREWPCSGSFPEIEVRETCSAAGAKIVQRGAANLRIPEIETALTIPPRSTPLHRILALGPVQAVLTRPVSSKQELIEALEALVGRGLLKASIVADVDSEDEEVVMQALGEVMASAGGTVAADTIRREEFEALTRAARFGAPPTPAAKGRRTDFEVNLADVTLITTPAGHQLRVTPVSRLRAVMVQTGYRRLTNDARLVIRAQEIDGRDWYPGVELFGEGIFIDLPDGRSDLAEGPMAADWFESWIDPDAYEQPVSADDQDFLHPLFVWWHSLAHRIFGGLAIDSGYGATAIRERVYIVADRNDGSAIGGVLLYTAQPGGDGTLGGLISLVPRFDAVLQASLDTVDSCSNDPICGSQRYGPGRPNGASCYACMFASETSCEFRNIRLDRQLLIESPA